MTIDNIKSLANEYYAISAQTRNKCIEYIKDRLINNGDRVVFDTECQDEYMTVVYDGGRHPEYDSNAYSQVDEVFRTRDGNVYVDTEDADININELTTSNLIDLCEIIYIHLSK